MKTEFQTMLCRLIGLLFLLTSCATQTSEPEENVSYNSKKVNDAFSQAAQIGNIKSLVVSYNGNIVKEQYWRTGGAENLHDVRSVTKSVVGILTGIAIEKGLIKSIDQPINDFIGSFYDDFPADKNGITIKHLLTMSGVFQWDELTTVSGYNNWRSAPNQIKYILDTPLINQPGQTFTYNSAALHLLSVCITISSGMNTKQFAEKYLFEPLGISERVWETDRQGFCNGGAGLQISPRDMIKIGELILNKGEYRGKRIVSADWINQLSGFNISVGTVQPYSTGYGYCWWIGQAGNLKYSFANGWGGQFIVVFPSLNLVVTATNQWSGISTSTANSQWYSTLTTILTQIAPAFSQ